VQEENRCARSDVLVWVLAPSLALNTDEWPLPSSIIVQCDTTEVVKLVCVADKLVLESKQTLNVNNLWSNVVGFLSVVTDA
jgi:hypothetical protein